MARPAPRKAARKSPKRSAVKSRPKSTLRKKAAAKRAPARKRTKKTKATASKKRVARKPLDRKTAKPKKIREPKQASRTAQRKVPPAVAEETLKPTRHQFEVPPQVNHPKLTAAETKALKQQLEEERDRLMNDLGRLTGSKLDETIPSDQPNRFGNHLADVASDSQILETQLLQSGMEVDRLREVVHALERIDHRKYGVCERCGANIGIDRLMAKPHAKYCIVCRTHLERTVETARL